MGTIRRNITCKCMLCVIALAPFMLFWWNEPKTTALKTHYQIGNSSFLFNSNFTTKSGADVIMLYWSRNDADNAKGTLETTDKTTLEGITKGTEQKKLTGKSFGGAPSPSTSKPMEPIVRKLSARRLNVWNENTSSRDLVSSLQQIKSYFVRMNIYKVTFPKRSTRRKRSTAELLCMLKNVNMELLKSANFSTNDSEWTMYLPIEPLHSVAGNFNRCAVVSSAGTMMSSRLGSEIDGHDAVLRFNAAPIQTYEDDVGKKTTLRLINSQVVTKPGFHFLNNTLYQPGTMIMWDPAPYKASLHEWYKKPEFKFTDNYKAYRLKNPAQPFYIMNPSVLWRLWDVIQANTLEDIQPNPPSSGMIGIVLMMGLCDEVNIYEYLPSRRKTDICHYYEQLHDSACGMGAFHPLTFEKNLVKQLNQGTDENIYFYGKATLPGFSKCKC